MPAPTQAPNVKPQHMMPVDSLENLKKRMLDPRAYGSCARSTPGECRGCPVFDRCEFTDKGSGRPRNGGVRIVKSQASGGGIREVIMACFSYWGQKDTQEMGGNLMDWIAEEGDEISVRGSVAMRKDPNGVPMPNTPYKDTFEPIKVPEFEGIDKSMALINDAYRAEIMKRHHDKKKADMREAAMAPPAGSVPSEAPSGDEKPKRR